MEGLCATRARERGAAQCDGKRIAGAPYPANAKKLRLSPSFINGERVRGVRGVGYDEEWDRQTEEQDSSTPRSPSVRPREP